MNCNNSRLACIFSGVVYLVGYTASYPEDEELDNLEEEDIDAAEDSSAWESFDAGTS